MGINELIKSLEKPIDKSKLQFIGDDGRDYYSYGALAHANEAYKRQRMPLLGADGQHYSSEGDLALAKEKYRKLTDSLQ